MAQEVFLTVTELSAQINALLQRSFPLVQFRGEISQCTRASSGHFYMTIKDENSQLAAVMWKGSAQRLSFTPEPGVEVMCFGKPNIYRGNGKFQIVIDRMEEAGEGLLQKQFLELKAKLEKEGLFDESRKRPLPFLPQTVGIITSKSGAAVHDIMTKIQERMPQVRALLYDARVQGDGAANEIAAGIQYFNAEQSIDVLIIGRGGGSLEDLWPFNEEVVVRAVFASRIPIISAVGHEVDTSLSDLVADVRAPTPTAAGEMVVPHRSDLLERVGNLEERLGNTDYWFSPRFQAVDELEFRLSGSFDRLVGQARARLESVRADLSVLRPDRLFAQLHGQLNLIAQRLETSTHNRYGVSREAAIGLWQRLKAVSPQRLLALQVERSEQVSQRLSRAFENRLRFQADRLVRVAQVLQALNPSGVLSRGFALVRLDGKVVSSSTALQEGSRVGIEFSKGSAQAEVVEVDVHSQEAFDFDLDFDLDQKSHSRSQSKGS